MLVAKRGGPCANCRDEATRPRVGLFKTMVHMLNHNYVIDRVFQAHLEGRAHGYGARNTPEPPPLEELRRAQEEIDAWYIAWADRLTPEAIDEKVGFTYIGGGEGVLSIVALAGRLAPDDWQARLAALVRDARRGIEGSGGVAASVRGQVLIPSAHGGRDVHGAVVRVVDEDFRKSA